MISIHGNENVDALAIESLRSQQVELKLPYKDFKPSINKFLFNKWNSKWDYAIFNKW